jgi:superfamily II DNA or RNA helicase
MGVRPGSRVLARRERWQVESTAAAGDGLLVSLRGLGPHNLNDRRALLTPFDILEPLSDAAIVRVTGRARWRRVCRAVLGDHGGWLALRAADTASIDVLPYQLEPARAVLGGCGRRVLLADDVGLGKTVQAGLLAAELLARGAAEHVLLLTPAGLRDQWARELADRFGLSPTVVDLPYLQRLSEQLPPGVNPWGTVNVAITSLDFVKRAEVLPPARARGWDLVIVDEAHLVSPDSDRHVAAAALCARAAFVVLVTATPHNGDRSAFDALCTLGSHDDALVVFRRTRADVQFGGSRHVHQLRLTPSAADRRMHTLLDRYASAVRRERGTDDQAAQLLLTVLSKRALSSPVSLGQSVARRLAIIAPASDVIEHTGEQLWLPLQDPGGETDATDEAPVLAMPALTDGSHERQLLHQLIEAAAAAALEETKLRALHRLLRRLERLGESVIVFTEYRDTLVHLHRALSRDALLLHGGMSRFERNDVVDTFTSQRRRLLLATDAGGEGLNLHPGCRCVVHLELPWNPMRLEQRTGRVDRIGQRRRVHSYYLVLNESAEVSLLGRLKAKVERARNDVGATDPLLSSDAQPGCEEGDARAHVRGTTPDGGAVREAERILRGRTLRTRSIAAPPHGIASSILARGRRRAGLRGEALLVLSVVAEAASGRVVATHAVGLRVALSRRGDPHLASELLALRGSPLVARSIEEILRRFRADGALDGYDDFWAAARARALAIEERVGCDSSPAFQPGLFDRRAERHRQLLSVEHDALAAAAARRRERYAQTSQPPSVAIRTRLLLLPSP